MPDNKEIKKNILLALSTELTEFKFKVKASSFIREPEPGLYQIIDIGLGQSTSSKANNLGISFGITTEEWLSNLNNYNIAKNLTSSHCEIKDCYCKLIPWSNETIWYNVSLGLPELVSRVNYFINESVLPFFNLMTSRQGIIEMWRKYNHGIGLAEEREFLAMGTLMYLYNNKQEGEKMLRQLLEEKKENSYFTESILKTLKKNQQ